MKLFLISSDNKAPDLYDRLKYFIIVIHLEIVLFENSCFIISVVRRFTWWVIHLTSNICGQCWYGTMSKENFNVLDIVPDMSCPSVPSKYPIIFRYNKGFKLTYLDQY